MDQRTCIKFCVKNEIKCADAFRMLTVAYGEATLGRSNVYRWYKMFSEGREDVNDEERAGRPSTSTTDEKINEVEKMILANRRITVREVTEDLNISIGSYDVETKAQSSQWKLPHEPKPKKARQVRSNVNVLLTVFFDCRGVVHHEFLPQGKTVNKEYYLQVMRNLREAIRQKRPDLWKNKNWLLHHDNAPAHTSLLVRDFLAKNNTLMMLQPPTTLRYARRDKDGIEGGAEKILKNDFLKCFEDWKNRWHKLIISHGDYFEGDKIGKIPILRRPDKGGTLGISINLLVNFFQLKHIRDQVYRYDVDLCLLMKSEETKEIYKKEINKKFKRKLFELFRVKCPQLQGCFPVYDGDKMMLTARKLATPTFTFVLDHFENERQQSYQLDVKPIKNGNNVVQLRKVGAGYDHYEAMTAIEVIFRYRPAFEFVPVGRSLFPKPTQPIMLAGGIEMWQGYYLSVQIGTAGAFVNLDRAATAFYPEGPLIRFVYELARSQDWTFIKRNLDRINKFLHHLKVTVTQGVRRSYTVDKLVVETASQKSFRNKENRKLTVEEYYRENYNNCRLRYPEAPLVQMTPNKGFSPFIPLEFCMIKDGQPYRHKLNEDQTSDMIKINAVPPEKRFKEIEQKMIDFSRVIEPLRNAYEIDIDLSPFKLIGRILKPPSIIFHQNRQREIRDGKWDLRGVNFYDPCTINCWLLISFAYERFLGLDRLSHFGKVLVEQARQLGINMKPPEDILFGRSLNFNPQNTNCQTYINFFHDIQNAYRNVDLVVVVLGNKFHKDQHSMVKRACDIQLCIPSQCIKDDNASKARIQLVVNLLKKINTKMGGINSVPRPRQNFKIFNKPCIVMGADVNHPAPGDVITPSIAAVVGSIDSHLFRYVPDARLQTRNQKFQSRLEIIQDLSKMIKKLLKAYYKTNSQRPQSILFFRDGVSEGQFQEVLRDELSEIKRACADLSKVTDPYNPTITFVVVQKRHHARFKPENPHQSSGKCGNIPPGTTVDTDIIHPHNFDYYQCSHLGIQGTSRPTKYVVLHDENKFTSDEMQEMTNFLCHTFSRCTSSISLVAPAQYAHQVAFRTKEHLSTLNTDLGKDNVISKEMLQAITLRDPFLRTIMKAAYDDKCLSQNWIFEWIRKFKSCIECLDDAPRPGALVKVSDDTWAIDEMIENDRHISIRVISAQLNLSYGSPKIITKHLKYRKICARWVPPCSQRKRRKNILTLVKSFWKSLKLRVKIIEYIRKRPEIPLIFDKLHHDNARVHISFQTPEAIGQMGRLLILFILPNEKKSEGTKI
ncbi:AGO3 [Cordylochernes scorpioides]|uniref:AGO3 n=1 Tax=Cordylochernes scorpioides TaxID=51811 RepID=A0ABY6K1J8_9ARAC|nr:AGO3 [Cordylochernes scorpioides]